MATASTATPSIGDKLRIWSNRAASQSGSSPAGGCLAALRLPPRLCVVIEPTTKAVEAVCAVLGLGNAWAPALQRLGVELSEPMAWRRRFLTDTEPIRVGDLRVAALRMQGLGPTRIATRIGRRSIPPRHHLDRIAWRSPSDWQTGAQTSSGLARAGRVSGWFTTASLRTPATPSPKMLSTGCGSKAFLSRGSAPSSPLG